MSEYEFPITSKFSIRVRTLIEHLQTLDPEAHIMPMLIPTEGEGAWHMWLKLSAELENFKWDAPVHQLRIWHPAFTHLPEIKDGT